MHICHCFRVLPYNDKIWSSYEIVLVIELIGAWKMISELPPILLEATFVKTKQWNLTLYTLATQKIHWEGVSMEDDLEKDQVSGYWLDLKTFFEGTHSATYQGFMNRVPTSRQDFQHFYRKLLIFSGCELTQPLAYSHRDPRLGDWHTHPPLTLVSQTWFCS